MHNYYYLVMQNTKDLIDQTGQAYQEFKATNDQNSTDPLVVDKLNKLNNSLNSLSAKATNAVTGQAVNQGIKIAVPNLVDGQKSFSDYARSADFISMNGDGYPMSNKISTIITAYLNENSIFRQYANAVSISRESFEFVKNKQDVTAQWSDGTTAPDSIEGYAKINIPLNDLIAQPKVTQKLLDDVQIDLEAWLARELGQIFLAQENEAFINGNGVNKPKGILSYAGSGTGFIETVKTGDASKITVDGLINLIYSLSDVYSNNAVLMMNKTTVQEVRKLKDSNGQYLWMPGILSGQCDTLMGVDLKTMSNIPGVAAGNICALYGNLEKAYIIADHDNIAIQKDPFSSKPFVSFYCTKRVGGDVINTKAMKLLKISV